MFRFVIICHSIPAIFHSTDDATRVLLKSGKDDYINASWMDVSDFFKKFFTNFVPWLSPSSVYYTALFQLFLHVW